MNSARLERPVSVSWKAWRWRRSPRLVFCTATVICAAYASKIAEVVVAERAQVAQPVGDDQRSEERALTLQERCHRVREALLASAI